MAWNTAPQFTIAPSFPSSNPGGPIPPPFLPAVAHISTRNSLTFVNTTAIAYTKVLRLRPTFCMYAIAVVFTNVRELRVVV